MWAFEWQGVHTHFHSPGAAGSAAALGLGGEQSLGSDPDPASLVALSGDDTPPFLPPGGGPLEAAPGRAAVAAAAARRTLRHVGPRG